MLKNIAVVVLYSYLAYAQGADSLTNETIIKMVQAGVPSAAIIKTIVATDQVSLFRSRSTATRERVRRCHQSDGRER